MKRSFFECETRLPQQSHPFHGLVGDAYQAPAFYERSAARFLESFTEDTLKSVSVDRDTGRSGLGTLGRENWRTR
ncbi:hypothetical protein MAALD49_39430 (plasmid) [Marinobacter shengliensis]|nr:hypothetical protein MAALD49_39430 [Marinobacter shengliensis]